MSSFRNLILLCLSLALTGIASGQITVDLRLSKRSYLAGEPIPATISLTNMTGRDLTIRGTVQEPWIDFIVKSSRGVPIKMAARPTFGAVSVPASQTVARTVDLAQLYAFSELGNYSIYAIVRLPGQGKGGFQSRRHQFTISSARPYWSQKVGYAQEAREYRLLQFSSNQKLELYAQVSMADSGKVLATHALGEVLFFRKPSVTVDGALKMHVLYLVTPSIWGHVTIDQNGKFLGRDLYKNPEAGFPRLVKMDDGTVQTVGGVPYDPKAIAEAMKKTRKASERPAFVYPQPVAPSQ